MFVIRDLAAAERIPWPEIRSLLGRRIEMLSEEEPFDSDVSGYFIVVEPADSVTAISQQIGFDVLANRLTELRFDDPAFTRSFEVLEEHRTCFEIVFVLSDDGYGVVVFVPKEEGVDADLTAMCSMHSAPAQESSS